MSVRNWTYGYDLNFLNEDTPFRSWFLGLFVTDGHLSNKKEVMFGFTDKQLIDNLVLHTNYVNNVSVLVRCGDHPKWKDSYLIRFSSPIANKLISFGFSRGKKSGKTFVPMCVSDNTFSHFLRGVVEGDGCFRVDTNFLFVL